VKCLEWAGHIWLGCENLIRNVLIRKPTKKRSRERLCQHWLDGVKKDISDNNESMSLDEAINRNGWRSLVELCKKPQWPV